MSHSQPSCQQDGHSSSYTLRTSPCPSIAQEVSNVQRYIYLADAQLAEYRFQLRLAQSSNTLLAQRTEPD
ncbi:hypothetical protein D3C86_1371390 [compost metagenome]